MCTRLTLATSPERLQAAFPEFRIPTGWRPRYNLAPNQPLLVVPNASPEQATFYLWGFIPRWAKPDPQGRYRSFINARAETLWQKPTFRSAARYRRCLILADGFYEWTGPKGQRQPWRFIVDQGEPFAIAGIWDRLLTPDGSELLTCALLTTEANERVRPLHPRMPVILPREAFDLWLRPGELTYDEARPWLAPFPAERMQGYPVTRRVNNPRYDEPDAIRPLPDERGQAQLELGP
ncbi:MAG: SOS response-associated peptidase [Chloroflexi bacterium]|nr:SOS response-associated peptidase [Chloroflexota bacterium]